jgi:hypothetical protein
MTDRAGRVAIIVSPEAEPHLSRYASDRPVWVIRTPRTERSAAQLREAGHDVTDFVSDDDPEAALLSIVDEVSVHHDSASGGSLVGLDVVGTPASDRVRERLESLGFWRLEATDEGFVADRA